MYLSNRVHKSKARSATMFVISAGLWWLNNYKNTCIALTRFVQHKIYLCQSECRLSWVMSYPIPHQVCKFLKHNQLHQLNCMQASTERNAPHLQNKIACRKRRERERRAVGYWVGWGEVQSWETNHPLFPPLLVLGALTGSEPVTHCPWDIYWNAKTCHCSCYYKVNNHSEVKRASLEESSKIGEMPLIYFELISLDVVDVTTVYLFFNVCFQFELCLPVNSLRGILIACHLDKITVILVKP